MKCFLHIGTEKTATSTIQSFFNMNRQNLLKKGWIYTSAAGVQNNLALPVAAYDLKTRDSLTQLFSVNSDNDLSDLQSKIIFNLRKEIMDISRNNQDFKIVFSSELLQSRLVHIEEIKRLKEILYLIGVTDVSVIVYLRRPAEIANSLYSTALKVGHISDSPQPPTNYYIENICNHRNTLEKWGSVFGKTAIVPRLFEKDALKNGSIIYDLLNEIGLSIDHSDILPKNANKSLSRTGVDLLKRLNHMIPRLIDDQINPVRDNLASYFEKYFTGDKYVMAKHLYEEYDLAFRESNEWVRKLYFPERKTLFEESIPEETIQQIPEAELDRIADFIACVWNDKQNIIIGLNSK